MKQVSGLLVSLLLGSTPAHPFSPADSEKLTAELDRIVVGTTLDKDGRVHRNAVVLLEAPSLSLDYRKGAGTADIRRHTPMSKDHQFYIESITKTFTATLVLQLAEEGRLGARKLDTTLAELEIFPTEVLDQLHLINGESHGPRITVNQLLHHRTGMKNFTYDDANGANSDYPDLEYAPGSMLGLIINDPERGLAGLLKCAQSHLPEGTDSLKTIAREGFPEQCDLGSYYLFYPPHKHWDYAAWKNDPKAKFAGLLNFYLSGMNETALFPPGEDFAYTDTNYLILGLLIEKITGNNLHTELRRRIFDPLGMDHSYMSYATDPPESRWRRNLSELWAIGLPIVSLDINRSMMWSDAGIVSTVGDLNVFIRALAKGRVFKKDATLQQMIALPSDVEMGYACGVGVRRNGKETILFHTGGAASWMIYYTKADMSFVGTMNDAGPEGFQRFGKVHEGFREVLSKHGVTMISPF